MEAAIIFHDKFTEYLLYLAANSDNGGLTSEQIEIYQKAYRELLPKLWEEELRAKKSAGQSFFIPTKLWYRVQEILARRKVDKILSFLVSIAQAQQVSSPILCYRGGVPTNPGLGSQRISPCCNCGFNIFRRGRWGFVEDCGLTGCTLNLGCLNRACPLVPAIWDPTTCICGCDI